MRSPSLFVRGLFVAAALSVLISGGAWWLRQRVYAKALSVASRSPLVYNGPAPVSRQLAVTLSSYHATDEERSLFKRFTVAEEKHDQGVMRSVIRTMAKSYETAGEQEMAVELNKRAVEMGKAANRRRDAAESLQEIADVYQKMGKLDRAADYGRQAADEYERIDARRELDMMLRRLTLTYRALGKYEEARACLAKANRVVASMHKEIHATAKQLAKRATSVGPRATEKKPAAVASRASHAPQRETDQGEDDVTGGDAGY